MAGIQIIKSVGINGVNTKADIKVIQSALNKVNTLLPQAKTLIVDGSLGRKPELSKTVAMIKLFQTKVLHFQRADGLVEVNGRTHRKLKEKVNLLAKPVIENHDSFVTTVPWMKTAFAEVGQSEISGVEANPRILEYFKASRFWGTDDSGGANAWCGSFVAWVIKKHGYEPVKSAYRAKEWMTFGKQIDGPIHGAIGIKSRKGGGHVAFVVGKSVDGKYLYMLGGNQGNKVSVTKYLASVWDTFVIPAGYDNRNKSLPIYTKAAVLAGSES